MNHEKIFQFVAYCIIKISRWKYENDMLLILASFQRQIQQDNQPRDLLQHFLFQADKSHKLDDPARLQDNQSEI